MKTHLVAGAAMLLTLGSSVAGTYLYGQGRAAKPVTSYTNVPAQLDQDVTVTPEMIAMWRATAVATDYASPRIPI